MDTLLNIARELADHLNKLSEQIAQLEDGLEKVNCHFPFSVQYQEKATTICLSWSLSDETKNGSYRLMLSVFDHNRKPIVVKPLRQTKLKWRLRAAKYLTDFEIKYRDHLKEYLGYIKKAIE